MKNFNSNTTNDAEWLTPPEIITSLGTFDVDPCAPVHRPWNTATTHYTKLDDGLSQKWQGRIWLNPPYGRDVFRWLDKLRQHRQKQSAFTISYGVPQMPYSFLGVACASTTLTEKKAAQPTRRLALCRTV